MHCSTTQLCKEYEKLCWNNLPESALSTRNWAVTLMEENPGGQKSTDISRAWGPAKLQSVLSVFGISWAKGMPLADSVHQVSAEWTHWFPMVCQKRREKSKITSVCSHLAVTLLWAWEVQADSQILSFISLLPSDADLFMQVLFEAAAHHL